VRRGSGKSASLIVAIEKSSLLLADIPRIPGLLDAIFRLIEARSNEIRSQPTR
jgi:hypothetical protein